MESAPLLTNSVGWRCPRCPLVEPVQFLFLAAWGGHGDHLVMFYRIFVCHHPGDFWESRTDENIDSLATVEQPLSLRGPTLPTQCQICMVFATSFSTWTAYRVMYTSLNIVKPLTDNVHCWSDPRRVLYKPEGNWCTHFHSLYRVAPQKSVLYRLINKSQ